jgi:hypothetical protein
MMARAASFPADQTGRELAEEGHHLRPPERAPDENLARATDGVHLEDVLGQVDADGRDLHRSGSKLLLHDSTFLAPRRREREPSSPSALLCSGLQPLAPARISEPQSDSPRTDRSTETPQPLGSIRVRRCGAAARAWTSFAASARSTRGFSIDHSD